MLEFFLIYLTVIAYCLLATLYILTSIYALKMYTIGEYTLQVHKKVTIGSAVPSFFGFFSFFYFIRAFDSMIISPYVSIVFILFFALALTWAVPGGILRVKYLTEIGVNARRKTIGKRKEIHPRYNIDIEYFNKYKDGIRQDMVEINIPIDEDEVMLRAEEMYVQKVIRISTILSGITIFLLLFVLPLIITFWLKKSLPA